MKKIIISLIFASWVFIVHEKVDANDISKYEMKFECGVYKI